MHNLAITNLQIQCQTSYSHNILKKTIDDIMYKQQVLGDNKCLHRDRYLCNLKMTQEEG
jgi:hypothetical protein